LTIVFRSSSVFDEKQRIDDRDVGVDEDINRRRPGTGSAASQRLAQKS
jgi:hypothetical protein